MLRLYIIIVRMKGLEPPNLAASDPKSDAVTNFATSANWSANIEAVFRFTKF